MAKYSKKAIKKLTGEQYPFGNEGQDQPSFSEMFDTDRFDRLEQGYRRVDVPGLAAFSVKGYPPSQETLDLHGCTGDEADQKTINFVTSARQRTLKTVQIITGKGLHSPGGVAVLPDIVEQRLRLLKKQGDIVSFRWEKRLKAKSGTVLVYL